MHRLSFTSDSLTATEDAECLTSQVDVEVELVDEPVSEARNRRETGKLMHSRKLRLQLRDYPLYQVIAKLYTLKTYNDKPHLFYFFLSIIYFYIIYIIIKIKIWYTFKLYYFYKSINEAIITIIVVIVIIIIIHTFTTTEPGGG